MREKSPIWLACCFSYPTAQAVTNSEVNPSLTKSIYPLSPAPCANHPSMWSFFLPAENCSFLWGPASRLRDPAPRVPPFPTTLSSLSPLPREAVEPESGAEFPARQRRVIRLREINPRAALLGFATGAERCWHATTNTELETWQVTAARFL